jgi:hypothetical protein
LLILADASFSYNSIVIQTGHTLRIALAVFLVALSIGPTAAQSPPDTSTMDDEQFLSYLE